VKVQRRLNSVKPALATNRLKWLKDGKTNLLETAIIFLMIPERLVCSLF
jgi:hypothetical protein